MWVRLKATINGLKITGKKRSIDRRNLRAQLKEREGKIIALTAEIRRLGKVTEPEKVFNHVYPVQMMILAVFIVVHGGGSLRCAAATVEFFAKMMSWESYNKPSPTTIRNWVLRCGYYALTYARDLKGDYVVIIDESIQIGKEKLLLMLGVKVETDRCRCAPLSGQDVEVLGMEVQSSWAGKDIAEFIQRKLSHYPLVNLLYVVSDQGASLLAAVRSLNLAWVSDCTHVMMNAVKELFDQDAALSELSASIGQLRRQLTLSDWGALLPPTLRDKDRFLRIFTIVEWAERLDQYWNKLPDEARAHVAFYRRAWPLMHCLRQVRRLIVISSAILKTAGLSQHSHQRWKEKVKQYGQTQNILTRQAQAFIAKMETYFTRHAKLYQGHCQVLCCSDMIESTFSRYKNKGGMKASSADVLNIALYNRKLTPRFIQAAMTEVSGGDVEDWQQHNVCHNRYGLRKRMDRELKSVG